MALLDWFRKMPLAATQGKTGGVNITTPEDLERAIRGGSMSGAGVPVTPDRAIAEPTVFACVRIKSSIPANMPIDLMRKTDARTREEVTDDPLAEVLSRRPNRWQTPSQFKRMMHTHLLLRGNAYALIVRGSRSVIGMIPLHPDRVSVLQTETGELSYTYRHPKGAVQVFRQAEIFHLVGLSLDGITGVSPIKFARETIGLSLAMQSHGSVIFRNGARASMVLKHPHTMGGEAIKSLQAALDEFRSGGENEGRALILEEGMTAEHLGMTSEDAQWIESRRFSRTDICMFFGVPPHMIGDTEKSTSWGSGIESQTQGFVSFSAEDDLVTWEETINRDLVDDPRVYARFNRSSLVRANIEARWNAHVRALQWGVKSPNEIRADEDMNPREGGDIFYPPPNTAGNAGAENGESANEPSQPAENRR